jgi:hypothetical protein
LILIKASIGLLWFKAIECAGENHVPKLALMARRPLVKLTKSNGRSLGRLTQFKGYGVGAKC